MKKALTYLTLIDFVFLLFLGVSGLFSGALGNILYYTAFLFAFLVATLSKRWLEKAPSPPKLKITRDGALLTAPLVFPTLALVFLLSYLTSLLLSFVGEGSVSDVSGNILTVILTHAVLTAILEEILFRYIPLSVLLPFSRRGAVFISALFFAFAHCNLYQIPYALVAGIIFATVDIAFDSIIPSLALHFLNNLASIFWIRNAENAVFLNTYVILLISGALISLIAVFILRRGYKKAFLSVFSDKREYKLSYEPILFILVALAIAIINL